MTFIRLVVVAALIGAANGAVAEPEEPRCDGTWAPCFVAAATLGAQIPNWIGLAIYGIGALTCVWQACTWEGTGPGTRTRRK